MVTYKLNKYGLRDKDMQYLEQVFLAESTIEKVVLYGSRARGDFERGSDVDLAIFGENISSAKIAAIRFQLENESPMLLYFDLLYFEKIMNTALKEIILNEGKVIYTKQ